MAKRPELDVYFPPQFEPLLQPHRYKIYYGGRGGMKSWAFAKALVIRALEGNKRILCAREFQNSIADSVHKLISDQITRLNLSPWFNITKTSITSTTGSEFIFKGLARSIQEIKSTEGIDIAWIEEAQNTSEASWEIIIPTIRKENSEIWASFNPDDEADPTYKRFIVNPPPGAVVRKVNWSDNPHFPDVLDRERRYMLEIDPEAYQHVWEGFCRQISDAQVFRGRFEIVDFDPPGPETHFYYGADWGFSQDPTALSRWFIRGDCLYIDYEAYGVGVELDDLPQLFDSVPGARDWPIMADNARPETISHMVRRGFKVHGAEKWSGSVEDGLAVLKSFRKIYIHPRCKHAAEEFRLYSYKVDKKTNEILPILIDKHNHIIDSGRYALGDVIKQHNFFDNLIVPEAPPLSAGGVQ